MKYPSDKFLLLPMFVKSPSDVERFWNKVNKQDGCWEWKAVKWRNGYGQFIFKSNPLTAHRKQLLTYQQFGVLV